MGAQPIISTRNIQSTIRLKDGETNFLAGLIRNDETSGDTGVPGLSDIPILGRFFSKKTTDKRRTDLVLTLTPHIIRRPDITADDLKPLWVGTEGNLTFRGGSPQIESEVDGPFDEEADDEDENERIRDLIRRRIQSLPQGLRDDGAGDEGSPGVELVPSSSPSDPFGSDDDDGDDPPLASLDFDRPSVVFAAWAAYPQAGDVSVDVIDTAAAAQESPLALSLRSPRREAEVGSEVEISVFAEARTPISHLPMTLRFDSTRLELVRVKPGPFLGAPDKARVLSDRSRPGLVVLGPSRLGRVPGVSGEGVVASLIFRPLVEGPTRVRFTEAQALDADLDPVTLDRSGMRLNIVPQGSLPPLVKPSIETGRDIDRDSTDQE